MEYPHRFYFCVLLFPMSKLYRHLNGEKYEVLGKYVLKCQAFRFRDMWFM